MKNVRDPEPVINFARNPAISKICCDFSGFYNWLTNTFELITCEKIITGSKVGRLESFRVHESIFGKRAAGCDVNVSS
jgi:hypothetical protein